MRGSRAARTAQRRQDERREIMLCAIGCALCLAAAVLLFRFIITWEQREAVRLALRLFD